MLNLIQNLSYRQKETDPVRQLADRQVDELVNPVPKLYGTRRQNYVLP